MDPGILIDIQNLHTNFYLREGVVKAVNGASLTVAKGRTLGVVGESGCGKSVTAQSILQIVPRSGRIESGDILLHIAESDLDETINITDLNPGDPLMRDIRGSRISMIFQEPMTSFSPVHTVGNQLEETIKLHQPEHRDEAPERVLDMLRRVGIANPERNVESYPHQLSGGMRQRAMIAMALMLEPSLLIADEPTTALDVTTEAQILALMRDMQSQLHMAIMFITHDLGVIAEMADDVAVMYLGRVVEKAPVRAIFHSPKHPYLQALLESIPRIQKRSGARLKAIEGVVPNPLDVPSGCPFHLRCPDFIPGVCDEVVPADTPVDEGHTVACHLYTD